MRVAEARPKKVSQEDKALQTKLPEKITKHAKKKKAQEEGVIPGHELQDRKVKRGWTEPSSESKSSKQDKDKLEKTSKAKPSSLTGEVECLFKTTLPVNVATSGDTKDGKVKKRKRGDSKREVIVHEFSNTTKHAGFLRDNSGGSGKKAASEYVEGKGWVDEDGSVLEVEPKRRRSKAKPLDSAHQVKEMEKPRSRRSSRLEVPSVQVTAPKTRSAGAAIADDETSSSGTSSSSGSESEAEEPIPSPPSTRKGNASSRKQTKKTSATKGAGNQEVDVDRVERLSITRSSATPPPLHDETPRSVPTSKEVHPLEALFKRPKTAASHTPKKPNLEVSTSFSFFEADADEGESQGLMPQTPFTQQDIRQRRQRSAAPTPDTAAPGKTFGDIWEGTSDVSEGDDEMEADATLRSQEMDASQDVGGEKPESDFSKWFWEHRGETNRAWKRRRREAAKDKRQKDNKERRG